MNLPESQQPSSPAGGASDDAPCSANPTRQPCKTCRYFHSAKNAGPDGWCESIDDDVKSWWNGCVRHSPNDKDLARRALDSK